MHDRVARQAHSANAAGATADAAALFEQASQLDPRPATIISHINMRLKLGQNELAAACYQHLMDVCDLSEKQLDIARSKLEEAEAAAAVDAQRVAAAALIGRCARHVVRRRHATSMHAACVVQRRVLRWLHARGRAPLPLVEHLALLRMGAQDADCASLLFHEACADVRTCKMNILAVAPFCRMALQASHRRADQPAAQASGRPLQFCLTTKMGERVYACALCCGTAALSECCLVLLGRQYTPRAFAGAATALMPTTLSCMAAFQRAPTVSAGAAPGARLGSRAGPWRALEIACRPLITVAGPRATGATWSICCAGKILQGRLPPVRAIRVRAEPPQPALAPLAGRLGSTALLSLIAALLLEQKIILSSASPHRLAPAAHAATSLILPLRWCCTYVPLLPPSHHAVLNAPFPFIYGILDSHPVDMRTGVVVFDVDRGSVTGRVLQPLPRREADVLLKHLRHPPKETTHGFDGIAQASLAVLTSILREAVALAPGAWADSATAKAEQLDAALELLAERFVAAKAPGESRRFAELLCETSAFKDFLECLVQPAGSWPSWLHAFRRWTDGEDANSTACTSG